MSSAQVSVVGGGAVGKAVANFYGAGLVKIYDKYKDSHAIEVVAGADFIFVAVPTPFDEQEGRQDLTEMDDAIANLLKHLPNPEAQVVIVKSTVLPGTTQAYQAKYPHVNFVFNPEFLTQSSANEDFARPDKQLVGTTSKSERLAEKVMEILPNAPYKKILPASVCEAVKYAINSYYAFKVIFGNSIYDLCSAMKLDYNTVHEGLVADPRIVDSHFDVFAGGYRGYGGKCLPKDVKSIAAFARSKGAPLEFIETIIAVNERLTPSYSPPHEGEVRRGS